jgi:sarcosine oxidase subunit alpha
LNPTDRAGIRISLDGQAVDAVEGDTVAAALLRAGITTFTRSIKYHRPRGPFCLQGSCGQCLMRVDGVPSLPACRVRAEEGMVCERQNGPLGVESDLFRASDFLFPEGLDHHHLLTGSRVLGRVALEIARRLAGLGELPARGRPAAAGALRTARLAIVGAGSAGLAAAQAAGAQALVIEREARVGGSALLFGASEPAPPQCELLLQAECVGLYTNDTKAPGEALLVVRHRGALLVVAAERVIVATGGASQPGAFPGCDRPGVYAARGLLSLPLRVGARLAVVGDGSPEQQRCAEALSRKGYEVYSTAIPRRALGNPVRAIDTAQGERVRCDAVAVALPLAPLHELASCAGARAHWNGSGFPVETDADGRTAIPWLFSAGSVAGKPAAESGAAAGRAACL